MRKAFVVVIVSFVFVLILVVFTMVYTMQSKSILFFEDSLWDDVPESTMVHPRPSDPYFPIDNKTLIAFDNVLSPAECDYIILKAQDKFMPSEVGQREPGGSARTSESATIKKAGNEWIRSLEQRFADILQTKPEYLEPLQICRYRQGQFYKPHMDSDHKNRRLSTLLVYLNDMPSDEPGGRTIFVKLDAAIKPKKGTGVAWNNLDPNTFIPDEKTMHAGEAILKGHSVKYILNVWSLVN